MFLNNKPKDRPLKHSEWRKIAKKLRRKRKRQKAAKEKDAALLKERELKEASPTYQKWLAEQQRLEAFAEAEEARLAAEQHEKWLKIEEEAQKQFRELQKRIAAAREERAIRNAKIRLEWEREQQKLKELKAEKERQLEEQRKLQEKQLEEVETFLKDGGDTPEHLKGLLETNPGKTVCPFFQKTGACRFFDVCSRNHVRPKISRIILIPNFYVHFSLEKSENEHGSDGYLEFGHRETYNHFKEFFYDVVPEMEKCGRIKVFRVCNNHESHLRGNVYVEYATTRAALKSFQTFNGRYYGGKQLSVQFCQIESWKAAICGLYFNKRCPKGNSCNFLHVFRNPGKLYSIADNESTKNGDGNSERRNWRWSESPERIPLLFAEKDKDELPNSKSSRRNRSRSRESSTRRSQKRSRSRSNDRKRPKNRSRSRSKNLKYKKRDRSRSGSKDRSSCRKYRKKRRSRSSSTSPPSSRRSGR